jgi:hypothetical protein
VGRRGVISSFKLFLSAIAARRGGGGGAGRRPVLYPRCNREIWTLKHFLLAGIKDKTNTLPFLLRLTVVENVLVYTTQ